MVLHLICFIKINKINANDMCLYNIYNNIINLLSCKRKQTRKPVLRLDEENEVIYYYEVSES